MKDKNKLFIYIILLALFNCYQSNKTFRIGKFQKIYDPSINQSKDWYINDHCFIKDENEKYHLFGITGMEPKDKTNIYLQIDSNKEKFLAHATSKQLLKFPWQKESPLLRADKNYREAHVWAPYIIKHKDIYYLYYAVGNARKTNLSKIHLATSQDLYNWKRHKENPVIVDVNARDPHVIKLGKEWILYYTTNSLENKGYLVVAYQTSKDLIHWSKRGIAFYDKENAVGSESPYVFHKGDNYFLFVGPRQGRTDKMYGTEVFQSSNPFSFNPKNKIGRIDAHAVEIIQENNRLYVSHCGWGQGGVYIAEFFWK